MQKSFPSEIYPEIFVSPEIMCNAKSYADIVDKTCIELIGNTIVVMNYAHNNYKLNIGLCAFHINRGCADIHSFFTSNLHGIDGYDKKFSIAVSHGIHVLESPVKYIGKEFFGGLLNLFHSFQLSEFTLTPINISSSSKFYEKLIDYYPNIISKITQGIDGELIYTLK